MEEITRGKGLTPGKGVALEVLVLEETEVRGIGPEPVPTSVMRLWSPK